MKNLILFFLILLLLSFNLFSQVSHNVNFLFERLTLSDNIGLDNVTYTKVVYDDLQQTSEVGSPELPVKYINLIIPSYQKVKSIVLTTSNQKNIKIRNLVYPVQQAIPTSAHYNEVKFVQPDNNIYESEEPYPKKNVELVKEGYFDGNNHIITIAVYPVKYTPKLHQLIFSSDINIRLEIEAISRVNINVRNRSASDQLLYDNILKRMVVNTQDIDAYQIKPMTLSKANETTTTNFYKYVIVTPNSLKSSFDKFCEWKRRKGIDIGVVTTEYIFSNYSGDLISGIYDDAGKLRQYLSDAYQEGTVWALLAGDYTIVPIRYGAGSDNCDWNNYNEDSGYRIPTDLYFSDFSGDWDVDGTDVDGAIRYGEPNQDAPDYYPEIFVGRLLCTTNQEILNWTEKVINYEQNPGKGNTQYLTRAFMFESDHMQNGNEAEGVASFLTSFDTLIWRELPSYNDTNPTFPSGDEVINEMNNTRYGLWGWFGHGDVPRVNTKTSGNNLGNRYQISSFDEIYTDPYQPGNGLDNLNNKDYPAIIYSISCDITPFDDFNPNGWWNDWDKNMGEGFTVVTNAGGPALLGNTRSGWVTYSSYLFRHFASIIEAGTTNLGIAELISKNNYSGSYDHYLRYSHNLIGCPETEIWVGSPSYFTSVAVTDGGSYLTVNAGISGSTINVRSADNGASYNLTANNVTSYTFNTSVRPLSITITKAQYLPYTAITGGTLTTDATLWGKLDVLNTVTVSSGKTLTIEPGTVLNFASTASLVVNGNLNATGVPTDHITFKSKSGTTNSSWGTITFNGSGASGSTLEYVNIKYGTKVEAINTSNITIQYCSIDTMYEGIHLNNSMGFVLNNTITSNSVGHGIVAENSSYLTVNYNIITKTYSSRRGVGIDFGGGSGGYVAGNDIYGWDWGICAIWSSSPSSYSSQSLQKNNHIRNCNTGLMVYRLSYPWFGIPTSYEHYSLNSISNNSYNARVGTSYPEYESKLFTYNNWWGSYPPNTNLFQIGYSSYFYYTPFLDADPWGGLPKISANNITDSQGKVAQIPNNDDEMILKGVDLRLQGKYNEAKNYFISYLKEHPDNQQAYIELYNCYNKETASEIINFFNSLPEQALKDHKLPLSYLYLKEGDFKKAKEINNLLISENPSSDLAVRAKLNNIYILLYNERNIDQAIKDFNDVLKNKELSTTIELSLVHNAIETYGKVYNKDVRSLSSLPEFESLDQELGKNESTENSELPKEYKLFENFPNPFNPSTKITYQIPKAGLVTLKVYDILGKEVATIVNQEQAIGKYEVNFDASQLSSGVYIYKLHAGNFVSSKKMIFLK